MANRSWSFSVEGQQHTLEYEQSFSGKKKISLDGALAYESAGLMDMTTEFSYNLGDHELVLLIKPGLVDKYDLLVDDKSLDTGRIGPARVKTEETPDGLILTYAGGRGVFGIMVVFGLFFAAIPLIGIFSGSFTLADVMYIPLLFSLIGLVLAYWALTKLLNKTILTVDPSRVSVRHTPIPWFGNRELQASEIEKLFCESYEQKTRSGEGMVTVTTTMVLYRICAKLTSGKKVNLLAGLDQCYEALFVNRQLGRKLGRLVEPGLQHA